MWVLALACSAQFVDVLGVTVLIVALPEIQQDLTLSEDTRTWIAAAYPLLFGGCLVLGGRVTDVVGARRAFVAGMALVSAGALLSALAGTAAVLLAGRAVQGAGAALSVPAALAALLAAFPAGRARNRALGTWTMAGAVGGASGFVLGGIVTELAGWRWLFGGILPLSVLAVAGGRLVAGRTLRRTHLDLAGTMLSTAAVVLVILGFTRAQAGGFASPQAWLPLALAPAAAAAFGFAERRARDPLVPRSLWPVRPFLVAAGVAVVLTATTSGASVVGSLFLQQVLGASAGRSGAMFLLFSLSVVVGSVLAGWLLAAIGQVLAMTGGLLLIAASMATQALAVEYRQLPVFLIGLALAGLGLGAASVASTAYGTLALTDQDAGVGGGLLNAAAQVGTAVGIAVLLTAATLSGGYVAAYLLAAGVAGVAAALTARHGGRARSGPVPAAPFRVRPGGR